MRKSLRTAQNFICYYGKGGLDRLQAFDVAILSAQQYTQEEVEWLAASREPDAPPLPMAAPKGPVLLAYLSLGEDGDHLTNYAGETLFEPPDLPWAKRDEYGQTVRNPVWGSILVNLEHPGWQSQVLERAWKATARGFHGFFLDTVDSTAIGDRRAFIRLIRALRSRFPSAPIMLNRGFALLPSVQDLVDGILFESLSTTWVLETGGHVSYKAVDDMTLRLNLEIARGIKEVAERWELARFALDYTDSRELEAFAKATAKAMGFTSQTSDRLLTRLPVIPAKPPAARVG